MLASSRCSPSGLMMRAVACRYGRRLQPEHEREDERQVRPFERRRARQDVVRQRPGLVAEDVERHQQFELLERVSQAGGVGHGDQRIAAGDEQRAHLARAGGEDFVGQNPTGEPVIDGGEAADARAVVAHEQPVLDAELREVDDAASDQRAAEPVKVARDGVDDLLQPERQGAVGAHVDAGRAVQRGAVGGAVRGDHRAQRRSGDTGHRLGPFRRPGLHEPLDVVEPAHEARDALALHTAGRDQFVQEREEEEHVRVRTDEDVFASDLGGLGAARVDDEDFATARLDVLEVFGGVGDLQEAPLGNDRVGADDDEALRAVDVGEGQGEREAIDLAGRGELAGAVLGGRRVHALRADTGHEALGEHGVQRAEAGGGADVHGDRIGTDVAAQAPDFVADLGQGLVPRHTLPVLADALHGMADAVGRIVEAVLFEPLHAAEALGRDVVFVGANLQDLVILDGHLEPAQGLADAAKRMVRLRHGSHPRRWRAVY